MVCKRCGARLASGTKFCVRCGAPMTSAPAPQDAPQPASGKSQAAGAASKPPHILLRILFTLCAAILALHTLGSLAVGVCGTPTKPTDVHLSFSKKQPNGGRNDFLWTLDYHFTANGRDYSSFTTWHGTRWSPDLGWGKYQVNYLSFFPYVSRFQKHGSLLHASGPGDALLGGLWTLFTVALGGAATYLLLALGWPALPFFRSRKKKRNNRRRD